nr:serine/threonine-protein kinase [Thermoanaerobaculia bacterium]
MTDPWPGRTLGRYRIEAEIGRGGMGVVYRGRQLSLNRPVAIKILPPQLAADPQFRERFRQEAQVIAGLTHENIVGVYDVEEVEGQYFIVMELLEGESLRSIRERRRFSPQEVVAVGFSLARALAYAHGRGIVHRDIKSQNVMLTADGRVKLTDFGIARIVGGSSVKTQTGAVLGTPEYMAPEQA